MTEGQALERFKCCAACGEVDYRSWCRGRRVRSLGLRVAVVSVWLAANVIRLVAGDQRQRRKDVRVRVMNAVLIDRVCTLAGDGLRLSGL